MHLFQDTVVHDNTSSLALLYQHCAPQLLTYIRRHLSSKEDAEDLLYEVFLAALEDEKVARLREGEQQAWLWRVVRNKLVDHHRRQARRPVVALDEMLAQTLPDDDDLAPERLALQHEDHARLREHVAALPELHQTVLRLRFVQGLRCAEIGRRLNKSDAAIRMILSRTLNFLRGIYNQQRENTDHRQGGT